MTPVAQPRDFLDMMRILLTNNTLDKRGGSELYIKDVVGELAGRGWNPIVYSTLLGEVAAEIRSIGVPVIDDLTKMVEPPDLIHGQHNMDAMAAILRFPEVPVVHFCHGFLPWQEVPVKHPSVHRYVTVNELCREMLISEYGIPASMIEMVLNFADVRRFELRGPLPKAIKKALVFNNQLGPDSPTFRAIAEACREIGAEVDLVGVTAGNATSSPELILKDYDLVFASGRSAIEALVSGCAVIVCDVNGMAGLVTAERFEHFRAYNLGLRVVAQCPEPSVEDIRAELRLYDAAQCMAIAQRTRHEASIQEAVTRLDGIYRSVIQESRSKPWYNSESRRTAESSYLTWARKERSQLEVVAHSGNILKNEIDRLQARVLTMESQLKSNRQELKSCQKEIRLCRRQVEKFQGRLEDAQTKLLRYRGLRRFIPRWCFGRKALI